MIKYNEIIDGNSDGFEMFYDWIERHCKAEDHRKIQVLECIGGVYSLSAENANEDVYRTVADLIDGSDCKNGTDFVFGTQFCEIVVHGSMWTYANDSKSGGQNTRIIRIQ